MTVTDPIADMLTRIRNAVMVKKDTVLIPASRLKRAIADVLVDEGYVGRAELVEGEGFPMLRLYLKYDGGKAKEPVLSGLDCVSSRAGGCTPKGQILGARRRWATSSCPPARRDVRQAGPAPGCGRRGPLARSGRPRRFGRFHSV